MSSHTSFVHVTACLVLGFLPFTLTDAAAQLPATSIRAAALGNGGTALPSPAALHRNPALPARLTNPRINLFASRSFGLSELQLTGLSGSFPVGRGAVSLSATTFGFSQYRDTQFAAGYARRIFSRDSSTAFVGLLIVSDHETVKGYPSGNGFGAILGASFQISPNLVTGIQAANMHRPIDTSTYGLPQELAAGISYLPSETALLTLEVRKHLRFPMSVHAGAEFTPVRALALRIGIATAPRLFTTGIGVRAGRVSGNLALLQHYALGWSPAVSFSAGW